MMNRFDATKSMMKTGDEVELNQEYTNMGYGITITLNKGTRVILVNRSVDAANQAFWSVAKDGKIVGTSTFLLLVPEHCLSKILWPVNITCEAEAAEVFIWAYNEHGQPISISVPEDRLDTSEYKIKVMEE